MISQIFYPIFLSYRRNDAPGYVARLGDDLFDEYGDVVFRDVDNILSGDEWKPVLKRQVAQANILVALIGPRWLSELQACEDAAVDYVRYELNTARELKIPVIPVLVGNTTMPDARLLGDLAWLSDLQKYSLLDEQKRWISDSKSLVKRVGELGGLSPHQQAESNKHVSDGLENSNISLMLTDKRILLGVFVAIAGITFALMMFLPENQEIPHSQEVTINGDDNNVDQKQ